MIDVDGSTIESMIAEGRKIVEDAIAEHNPVAILAAFSGGNDSIVSTHFAAENFGATAVHCNTGTGLEKTREHVLACVSRFGWRFHEAIARPSGRPAKLDESTLVAGRWKDGATAYEEFVLNFGFPGPAQHARMFQRLKERPLARYIRTILADHWGRVAADAGLDGVAVRALMMGRVDHAMLLLRADVRRLKAIRSWILKTRRESGSPIVMIVSGIRHDESAIRAGYKRAVQREAKNPRVWVNPFYWRSAADFEMYRQEFGLPRNPVKARVGISGECNCGSFAKPGELEAIRAVEPERAEYLERLSARVKASGFPWGWGEIPPSWFAEARRGQTFLIDLSDGEYFMPMCVGCPSARR